MQYAQMAQQQQMYQQQMQQQQQAMMHHQYPTANNNNNGGMNGHNQYQHKAQSSAFVKAREAYALHKVQTSVNKSDSNVATALEDMLHEMERMEQDTSERSGTMHIRESDMDEDDDDDDDDMDKHSFGHNKPERSPAVNIKIDDSENEKREESKEDFTTDEDEEDDDENAEEE
eukprot:165383_1